VRAAAPRVTPWVALPVALLVGVLTCVCGFAVYRHAWRLPPVDVPWGLLLALATAFAVVRAAELLAGTVAVVATAAGWVLTLLWLQAPRPEGDFLLADDTVSYVYLFGGMLTVAAAVVVGINAAGRRRGGA
jgi:hypothetical protein